MQILIVEDEDTVAARLKRLAEELLGSQIQKLSVFHTLDDADDYLEEHAIDLLFLDLNLAGHDGFDLLKKAVAGSFHTIVVSAYAERAIEAFEFGVLDFVAKPFTKGRLEKALARFQSPTRQQETKFLGIKRRGIIESIPLENVSHFKGANIYSEVVLKDGEELLHDKPLNRLEQVLPATFIRVHKSFLVNEKLISGIKQQGNNAELVLTTGQTIPISRSKITEFKQRFI